MSWQKVNITTDKNKMDVDMIYDFLTKDAYWAKGRSRTQVEKTIQHSLCFGAFNETGEQVGFARVATDFVIFAWLMDVFVVPEYKGKGIGKQLVESVISHPELKQVKGIGLRTEDAQGFYKEFGFEEISNPDTWMLKTNE